MRTPGEDHRTTIAAFALALEAVARGEYAAALDILRALDVQDRRRPAGAPPAPPSDAGTAERTDG